MKKPAAAKKIGPARAASKAGRAGRALKPARKHGLKARAKRGALAVYDRGGLVPSVKGFCDSYGVTRDIFTRMTGFSPRAVANWSSGKAPGPSAQKKLTELTRLFDALSDLVDPKAIAPWLKTSNVAFEGSTPLQVIERGETDRLWRMIWQLESGNSG